MQDVSAVPSGTLPQNTVSPVPLGTKLRSTFGAINTNPVVSAQPISQQAVPVAPTVPVVPNTPDAPTAVQAALPQQQSDIEIPVVEVPDGQKLDILSAVLDQIEAEKPAVAQSVPPQPVASPTPSVQPTVLDQALPIAVAAGANTLNPIGMPSRPVAKERAVSSDQHATELAAGVQYVEQEPSPEIPVEVESFIQRVTDHTETSPHEVVIADGTTEQPKAAYPTRPVVVLPITEAIEDEGQKKSAKFSIRWLVEWSHKIIKMFAGKVIYRQVEAKE